VTIAALGRLGRAAREYFWKKEVMGKAHPCPSSEPKYPRRRPKSFLAQGRNPHRTLL
jgi:hypothetical protein